MLTETFAFPYIIPTYFNWLYNKYNSSDTYYTFKYVKMFISSKVFQWKKLNSHKHVWFCSKKVEESKESSKEHGNTDGIK